MTTIYLLNSAITKLLMTPLLAVRYLKLNLKTSIISIVIKIAVIAVATVAVVSAILTTINNREWNYQLYLLKRELSANLCWDLAFA